MPTRKETGIIGENIAVRLLREKGYDILARNARIGRRDEIDIIARDPRENMMVFVEVKSRAVLSGAYHPVLNVTPRKRSAMRRAARAWVAAHEYDGYWRIDIVCIAGGRVIGHYENTGAWR